MSTIEVGMYVRTKYGIAKILSTNYTDDIVEDFLVVDKELEIGLISGCDLSLCDKKDVINSSFNIIDLIEIGDYVNGEKITLINEQKSILYAEDKDCYLIAAFYEDDIKSIVTKEKFKAVEYRIGE